MYAAIAAFAAYGARHTRGWALAGGTLVGVGYLVRYSALTILPVGILWILARRSIPRRVRLEHAAVCLAGFLLASAPQLIPTALEHGNPFWNRQDSNVYFGMFGGMNWARGWQEATEHAGGLVGIIRAHPREFVVNIGENAARVVSRYEFLPAVLAVPGALLALRARGARPTASLVLVAALTYGLALCMTFITRRLMLPLWPALMLFAAYALMEIRPRHVRLGRVRLSCPLAVLAIVVCYVGLRDAVRLRDWLAPTDLTRVTNALRRHGMSRADEVLSFDFPYYYVGSRLAEPFLTPWYFPEADLQLHTIGDVVGLMRRKGMRFLVFNDNLRSNVSPLAGAWPDARVPPEFTELYTDPEAPHARVWRLRTRDR
jgi:4-amino-4-deoxy-L-arabinose transferase-like glycosyltransferase